MGLWTGAPADSVPNGTTKTVGADQSGGKDACTGSAAVDGNMGDSRVWWVWRRCGYVSGLQSTTLPDCRKTGHNKFEVAVIGWGFGYAGTFEWFRANILKFFFSKTNIEN
ncbi:hypothetical protein C1H46_005603 [Malus baccata]|uniref:Uncharacterized protein n=1 Tax=Malus baccata TaxID=106549 RepID=A0A540NCI1_MALBA|nr:hypothetical protein C1H46_005603 [Malus baccata]